ncbi:MAG: ACP S-malonyltransferase [Phycisphaerales bacterium]
MHPSRIILCPGQGAQALGMGKAWADGSSAARAVFEKADAVMGSRLGPRFSELCWAGPADLLNRTDASQPALYVAGVACWRGLLEKWNAGGLDESGVVACAGLSLGEYTALHVAGALSFEDGLELVTLRGRAMQDAADAVRNPDGTPGSGMVAIIGGDDSQAEAVCTEARERDVLVCANYNAPGQVVLSGSISACHRAAKVAEGKGLRATVLTVAGAFHSPLMGPAAERLRAALAGVTITAPRVTVVSNVTASPHAADGSVPIAETIRRRLVEQLSAPVRWAQSCVWLASRVWGSGTFAAGQTGGGAEYHELAPGSTLKGLMRRIEKSVKVVSHDSPSE